MTTHTSTPVPHRETRPNDGRLGRIGGVAALLAAGTFAYGIVLFATSLADYTDPDATPTESVDFLVDHQGQLLAWYIGIFIVFGAALVPLALALRQRLVDRAPILAHTATVFAAIWAGLMYATGMVSNIGIEAVADLADSDPDRAVSVWSAIDAVTNGLGGGNELVGGIWIGLISLAGFVTGRLPRWLNVTGVVTAIAGLVTVVPAFEVVEMVFGLGSIVWFVGIGISLIRSDDRSGVLS
jgi:hypothetical protein